MNERADIDDEGEPLMDPVRFLELVRNERMRREQIARSMRRSMIIILVGTTTMGLLTVLQLVILLINRGVL
jgi:hypothetical protein